MSASCCSCDSETVLSSVLWVLMYSRAASGLLLPSTAWLNSSRFDCIATRPVSWSRRMNTGKCWRPSVFCLSGDGDLGRANLHSPGSLLCSGCCFGRLCLHPKQV